MAEISAAVMDHRAAKLPYLAYLRHPTTGGVFASWGSLAHVTVGEPGALIGFLGPKVYAGLFGQPFPEGVQRAENLAQHGVIDAVVAPADLPGVVDAALAVLVDPAVPPRLPRRHPHDDRPPPSAWEAVLRTREPGRAGVRDLLRHGAAGTVRLGGTEEGEHDASILIVLTRLDGQPCVVIGQDRTRQTAEAPMGPAALREARRAMRLAEELGLPLVTVIDTPGAELSVHAEEHAMAGEIARCIATMSTLTVPSVAVLLGQGCGGGAQALLPAQQVIAAEHAWLSPLPPEGASLIVHSDVDHAAELAESQRIASRHLLADGTVHQVVPELDGDRPGDLARAVVAEISRALWSESGVPGQGRQMGAAVPTPGRAGASG
jgi:acetyl-CoA carboxylase carboxyl transferase subunit beta